jgi:trehalose 6-phosphate synthase/phosphatase
MEDCFGDTDAWLAAENGVFLKAGQRDPSWHLMHDSLDVSWKERVKTVFRYFSQRTPSSFVVEHEVSRTDTTTNPHHQPTHTTLCAS